ncbi:hypothetical protein RQP46_005752 [Phenoliferia psychrophenolica]
MSDNTFDTKRTRIYTLEDVSAHDQWDDCWVVHDNKIYDVSSFLHSHPGGDDLILKYGGKDVTQIMTDPLEHAHSTSAYEMLKEFQIGIVGVEEHLLDPNYVYSEDAVPTMTAVDQDFARSHFIDLSQPLLMQVLRSNYSKAFYLQQVHQPRHLPGPARLFGPWYLEIFTKTPWYVVPIVWLPIAGSLFKWSLEQQGGASFDVAFSKSLPLFLLGNFIWTLLEYNIHRFVFHIERFLPDHPLALFLHFTGHGVHHYIPMDHLRLVMPPALFTILSFPFTRLAYVLFPTWAANAIISGAFAMYVFYDMVHYSLHYAKLPLWVRKLKSHHMNHHYIDPNLGFGITSQFWDWVFDSDFPPSPADRAAAKTA